jgi:hypothetical protein
MYLPNQIVWSDKKKKPIKISDIWSPKEISNTRHFIDGNSEIATPSSIEEANLLLERNRIAPAPLPTSHCWSCKDWLSHNPRKGCEAKEDHIRCALCGAYNPSDYIGAQRVCQKCFFANRKEVCLKLAKEMVKVLEAEKYDDNIGSLIDKMYKTYFRVKPNITKGDFKMKGEKK